MTAPFDDIGDWDDDDAFDDDRDEDSRDEDSRDQDGRRDDGGDDAMSVLGRSAESEGDSIVYVRKIAARDLPKRITDQIAAAQSGVVDPDEEFYAVCDEGKAIGLFDSRDLAFFEAREHRLTPVSVH